MTKEEKKFFISIAQLTASLSKVEDREGAVLIKNKEILSYGYNKLLDPKKSWEISAVFSTLYKSYDKVLNEAEIFTTNFPGLEEFKLMLALGIKSLYFLGKVNKPEVARMLQDLDPKYKPLEIIQLQ